MRALLVGHLKGRRGRRGRRGLKFASTLGRPRPAAGPLRVQAGSPRRPLVHVGASRPSPGPGHEGRGGGLAETTRPNGSTGWPRGLLRSLLPSNFSDRKYFFFSWGVDRGGTGRARLGVVCRPAPTPTAVGGAGRSAGRCGREESGSAKQDGGSESGKREFRETGRHGSPRAAEGQQLALSSRAAAAAAAPGAGSG